jgi:hypothetical protein
MFYVYTYKDPRPTKNLQVVYVGKGMGDRMFAHWRKAVHRNKGFGAFLALLRRNSLEPIIERVAEFDDEAAAFVEEMRLIALYGRRDLKVGSLFNLTDGGEGFSGAIRTAEWRQSISDALSTPEQKTRNARAAAKRWASAEYRSHTTAAIREALADPEVIARRKEGKAAFIHTEEFRRTMRAATTKMWQDKEYADKVVAAQRKAQGSDREVARKSKASKTMWAEKGEELAGKIKAARGLGASRAKTSAQAKSQWADPEYAALQAANNKEIANRAEVKAAKSVASKAQWADPEWRAKMLAARARNKAVDTPKS